MTVLGKHLETRERHDTSLTMPIGLHYVRIGYQSLLHISTFAIFYTRHILQHTHDARRGILDQLEEADFTDNPHCTISSTKLSLP